ncbi:MAG: heterodisulfide reductase [Desulfobacteraceae bacterium]|nr:heterodisulfide reductase [Desulfobacteraceae bacterium]
MSSISLKQIGLFKEHMANNGVHFSRCYHCRCCGNGCPFLPAFDFAPNTIIRLLQFNLINEALESTTIWACVGCNTCSMECPMLIDIAGLMDGLRQLALATGVPPAEPDILSFHQAVMDSISKYGRTNKLDIMIRYKLKTRTWLQDWQVGLKMLAKRKLDIFASKVRDPALINTLLNTDKK